MMTVRFMDVDGRIICLRTSLIAAVVECVQVECKKGGVSRVKGTVVDHRGRQVRLHQVMTLIGATFLVSAATARKLHRAMDEKEQVDGDEWKER